MKVITVASQKGGVGKSTTTIHMAVSATLAGKDVLVADLDPFSRTLTHWAENRESETPTVFQAIADDVRDLKEQAEKEGFDLLIFDCPPFVSDAVIDATAISDFTLVPCAPTFPEVQSLMDVIDKVHAPYSVVLNNCQPGQSGYEHLKTREIRTVLKDAEVPVSPVSVVRRVSYQDALSSGQAVGEFEPKSKACTEMKQLWKWVEKQL